MLLREAYETRKKKLEEDEAKNNLDEVVELLESHFVILEKLDTATISQIVDSMNGVEEALKSVLDKLPSLKRALDKAEQELVDLVSSSSGRDSKKTGKMLAKALAFYQNLTSFLRQDLPVLLKSRMFAAAKSSPEQPVGTKVAPIFAQALKIGWADRSGGFFKKLFSSSDIPYLDNNSFSQELANLSFNELSGLIKVGQVPGVLTQQQVTQMAQHLTSPSSLPGYLPQAPEAPVSPSKGTSGEVDLAALLDKFGGPNGLIDFLAAKKNEFRAMDSSAFVRSLARLSSK